METPVKKSAKTSSPQREERGYSEDFVLSCIVLGVMLGVGTGMLVSDVSHVDHAGIGAGLVVTAIAIASFLRILW
jgi:hypothetical protein